MTVVVSAARNAITPSSPRRQPIAKARLTEKSGARGESILRETVTELVRRAVNYGVKPDEGDLGKPIRHPELVEGSVRLALFTEPELILRQAQDDKALF